LGFSRSAAYERKISSLRLENVDTDKLKALFAMSVTQADAARVKATSDLSSSSSSSSASQDGGGGGTAYLSMYANNAIDDASGAMPSQQGVKGTLEDPIMLALRLKSLDIPPLSPDFGALMQPNGQKYRFSLYIYLSLIDSFITITNDYH
jgi:hypothetical protein